MACPAPVELLRLTEGDVPPGRREALLIHLETCADCWAETAALARSLRSSSPRPGVPALRFLPYATAAALLLAALPLLLLPHKPPAARGRFPSVLDFPSGALASEPASPAAFLGHGLDLLLAPGTRVEAVPDSRSLRLLSGSLWLTCSAAPSPVVLEMDGLSLSLKQGAIWAGLAETPRTAWDGLLRSAWAGDGQPEIVVLDGLAEIRIADRLRIVPAGSRISKGLVSGATPESLRILRLRRAEALANLAAPPIPSDIPPSWRRVCVLTHRTPSTEAGLVLGMEGRWYRWVPGLAQRPSGHDEVLEVLWDGQHLKGWLDGVPVLSTSRETLDTVLKPCEGPPWGILTWDGSLRVEKDLLLRDMP